MCWSCVSSSCQRCYFHYHGSFDDSAPALARSRCGHCDVGRAYAVFRRHGHRVLWSCRHGHHVRAQSCSLGTHRECRTEVEEAAAARNGIGEEDSSLEGLGDRVAHMSSWAEAVCDRNLLDHYSPRATYHVRTLVGRSAPAHSTAVVAAGCGKVGYKAAAAAAAVVAAVACHRTQAAAGTAGGASGTTAAHSWDGSSQRRWEREHAQPVAAGQDTSGQPATGSSQAAVGSPGRVQPDGRHKAVLGTHNARELLAGDAHWGSDHLDHDHSVLLRAPTVAARGTQELVGGCTQAAAPKMLAVGAEARIRRAAWREK